MKDSFTGYIPAESIESPPERLGRLNNHRNREITKEQPNDMLINGSRLAANMLQKGEIAKCVRFSQL